MLNSRTLLAFLILLPHWALGQSLPPSAIPDQLSPWKDWVLHGHEMQLQCTPSASTPEQLQCDWPSRLVLNVNDAGASFSQEWLVQHTRWIQLPGNLDNWPDKIKINDQPTLVIGRQGVPTVRLEPGTYTVTGSFRWSSLPEYLLVPDHNGLVSLVLNGSAIDFPDLDPLGRIWLQTDRKQEEKVENKLSVKSFRFIEDRIPMQIDMFLQLDVSGAPREIILGPLFPLDRFIPVSLNSSLPSRLEQDGRLRVQVRPGRWTMTLTIRHIDPVSSLTFTPPDDNFWPSEEIWAFSPHPDLRVVEIEGVSSIDPLQTSLPQQWHSYPAYRVTAGETMQFKEIKRGDPQPAPDQLNLNRRLWLRFDGSGYILQDTITGTKRTNWRLEMNPPVLLGRVTVDGQEQFITRMDDSSRSGVELRKGVLNLIAESEYFDSIASVPATGWDHDFQQVSANLFLPPGWRLLNATGVDSVQGTWVKRWTLLDFFIVLVLTLAIARLFSKSQAALAFVALVLLYHEPGSPRWIWLAILVCIALIRHLPDGKFRKWVRLVQIINIITLIVIALPFSVEQLRTGIYPQLEKPWHSMSSMPAVQSPLPASPPPEESTPALSDRPAEMDTVRPLKEMLDERSKTYRSTYEGVTGKHELPAASEVAQHDPSMLNQTGPGLPNWQWNSVPMNWSGPVQKDQEISLLLIGPRINLVLSFARVGLLVILAMILFNIRLRKGRDGLLGDLKTLLLIPTFLVLLLNPPVADAGQFPSPEMLEELRSRLLETSDCFPECADIIRMDIAISPDQLMMELRVSAQTDVFIPLPGGVTSWIPQAVSIGDTEAEGLFRRDSQLWLLVRAGTHTVTLRGKIPRQKNLQIPLPLKPHRVNCSAEGWLVEGIHENGKPDNQIQFRRITEGESADQQILETGILPPFLLVERTLRLGLTWRIETTVQRITPSGSAVVFEYPLLSGESVLTEGIRVQKGEARITLDPNQNHLQWESVLEPTATIHLRHSETNLWTEIWRADVSPIFHMETEGIPVILHQQGKRWYPTWHPWPGEEVNLSVTRPAGIAGQTMTVDQVRLESQPGRRATTNRITLSLRSSKGGQHTITLPENSGLQEVRIDNQPLPIRMENNQVILPVKPGKQEIFLQWNESSGISPLYKTPAVDLGLSNVNTSLEIQLPRNRWPMFMGGPLMGPAVLFWSVVLVLILAAFALSRTGLTPLKFHQWFLLGIGMSQADLAAGLLVAAWLIVLDLRQRTKPDMDKTTFNLMQIGIAALTVMGVGSLLMAISQGLLGHPDMNIVGNGSSSTLLKWYQDHCEQVMPRAWILSIPMVYYRLAMLAWALWISYSLISLLRWGWRNYTQPVIWHTIPRKAKRKKETSSDSGKES